MLPKLAKEKKPKISSLAKSILASRKPKKKPAVSKEGK
jgi:hypothetical protein